MPQLFDVVEMLDLSVVLLRILDVRRIVTLDGIDKGSVFSDHA